MDQVLQRLNPFGVPFTRVDSICRNDRSASPEQVVSLLRYGWSPSSGSGGQHAAESADAKPAQEKLWTTRLWVYDLRTNQHFTLKTRPLKRSDLDDSVACYKPGRRHEREETWSEDNPQGRWRSFSYEEIAKRDKLNLDITWLRDESMEDSDSLPDPAVLAAEIMEDLQAALEAFGAVAGELEG